MHTYVELHRSAGCFQLSAEFQVKKIWTCWEKWEVGNTITVHSWTQGFVQEAQIRDRTFCIWEQWDLGEKNIPKHTRKGIGNGVLCVLLLVEDMWDLRTPKTCAQYATFGTVCRSVHVWIEQIFVCQNRPMSSAVSAKMGKSQCAFRCKQTQSYIRALGMSRWTGPLYSSGDTRPAMLDQHRHQRCLIKTI